MIPPRAKLILRIVTVMSGVLVLILPGGIMYFWNQYTHDVDAEKTKILAVQGCDPYNFIKQVNDKGEVLISWQTREECAGYLLVDSTPERINSASQKLIPLEGDGPTPIKTVTIAMADSISTPYGVVVSNRQWYGIESQYIKIR